VPRAAGDEIARGGRRSQAGPLLYEPTLVIPRSNESEIVQREVFGPVLTYQTFADEDGAIELANSTAYGLSRSSTRPAPSEPSASAAQCVPERSGSTPSSCAT